MHTVKLGLSHSQCFDLFSRSIDGDPGLDGTPGGGCRDDSAPGDDIDVYDPSAILYSQFANKEFK